MPRSFLVLALAALFLAPAAGAQDLADYDYDNLTLSGLGVHTGWVVPQRMEPALFVSLRADLGLLGPNVRISPGITYWSSELRGEEVARIERRIEELCLRGAVPCAGIELGEVDISDLALGVEAHYLWTTEFGVEPYAGVGASLHLFNGRGDFIEDTYVEDLLDAVAPGLSAVGGLEVPLGPNLRLLGEARGTLTGTVRYLGFGVGASWTLPAGLRRPVPTPGGSR